MPAQVCACEEKTWYVYTMQIFLSDGGDDRVIEEMGFAATQGICEEEQGVYTLVLVHGYNVH